MKGILSFFEHVQLPVGFLDVDMVLWNDDPEYQHGLSTSCKLRVVNDTAERAILHIEDYNAILTKKLRNSTCSRSSNNIANTYQTALNIIPVANNAFIRDSDIG